jgi:hypothetical protein
MVSVLTIEDAIYDWVHLVLPAVPVIWYHQNAPRPVAPYLSLHLSVINSIGVDAVLPPESVHATSEIVGNRDFVLLCQGIGLTSMDFLETLKLSLEKPSVQAFLRSKNIVFVDRLANTCIATVVDNRYEERNILDLKFRFAQTDVDTVGIIEHVDIEKDFYSPDLNTITVEHITIP